MPAGGIKQLQEIVWKQRGYWDAKKSTLVSLHAPRELINSFIGFILAAMYAFKIQGRIQAFNSMTLADVEILLTDNRVRLQDVVILLMTLVILLIFHLTIKQVLSAHFKTAEKYGYQVIEAPAWLKPYIRIWLTYRSTIVLAAVGREDLMLTEGLMFLTSKLTAICGSRRIIKYYQSQGLNLSSTGIRKLFEMEASQLERAGKITASQRQSVHSLVGHSKATAEKYYLMRNEGGYYLFTHKV